MRVEDDWLSRRALRLLGLGRETQPTLSLCPCEHRRPSGLESTLRLTPESAMTRKLPAKDVVIVGLGWTGSIVAYELAEAGLEVVAIERGPWRDTATDYAPNFAQDELRYRIRHGLFLRPDQTTFTFRNKTSETALPIRTWGAFMPPNSVGGGGVHWNGETWRFLPSDFVLKTHLTQRYGAHFLPSDKFVFNPFIASGSIGMCIDEFNGDNFDHGPHGFVGGGYMGQVQTNGRPIETTPVPPGTPRWGAQWKQAVRDNYQSA